VSRKLTKSLADAIAIVHIIYIALILASLPLVLLYPDFNTVALTLIGILIVAWAFSGFNCPLTTWENYLRARLNAKKRLPNFISYHLRQSLGIEVSTRVVWFSVYAYIVMIAFVSLS